MWLSNFMDFEKTVAQERIIKNILLFKKSNYLNGKESVKLKSLSWKMFKLYTHCKRKKKVWLLISKSSALFQWLDLKKNYITKLETDGLKKYFKEKLLELWSFNV